MRIRLMKLFANHFTVLRWLLRINSNTSVRELKRIKKSLYKMKGMDKVLYNSNIIIDDAIASRLRRS